MMTLNAGGKVLDSEEGDTTEAFFERLARSIGSSRLLGTEKMLFHTYVREAQFFWKFLSPLIDRVGPRRVLEVGSGIGILSLLAATKVPSVTSLEPESSGFTRMGTFRTHAVRLWRGQFIPSYQNVLLEDLPEDDTFDFIFCVNVLEHVTRPHDLIDEIFRRLTPGGFAWFVCPNYSFPYEQHFEIPIVFSKSITQRLFRRQISQRAGLGEPTRFWDELSWPTQRSIKETLAASGTAVDFRTEVLAGYFARIEDSEFLDRKAPWWRMVKPLLKIFKPVVMMLPPRIAPVIEFLISKPLENQDESVQTLSCRESQEGSISFRRNALG